MSLIPKISIVCLLMTPLVTAAQEHLACRSGVEFDPPTDSQAQRAIASSCARGPVANLWYNRACHADLLKRYRSAMRLQSYRRQDDAYSYHSYRIFIGLSESLARYAMVPRGDDTVDWLNSIYDRAGEIAEMRLKGYGLQADHLEARLWSE